MKFYSFAFILFLFCSFSWSAKAVDDLYTINLKKGVSVQLMQAPEDDEIKQSLEKLSPEELEIFLVRRKEILTMVGTHLVYPKLLGSMSWFKNRIAAIKEIKHKIGAGANWIGEHLFRLQKQMPLEDIFSEEASIEKKNKTINELGAQALKEIINLVDYELWKDCLTLTKATHMSWTFYFGGSAGSKLGFYKATALELDIDVDFATQKKHSHLYWAKHSLDRNLSIFELHLIFGALKKYQILEENNFNLNESVKVTTLPSIVGYRRSDNSVAVGMVGRLSLINPVASLLINTAATIIVATGQAALGKGTAAAAKPFQAISLFWTNVTRDKIYSKNFKNKELLLFMNPKTCEFAF